MSESTAACDLKRALAMVTMPHESLLSFHTWIDSLEHRLEILESKKRSSKFVEPSFVELFDYCAVIGIPEEAQDCYDHYVANGWVQGTRGKPIVNWKAVCRQWKTKYKKGVFGAPPKPKEQQAALPLSQTSAQPYIDHLIERRKEATPVPNEVKAEMDKVFNRPPGWKPRKPD